MTEDNIKKVIALHKELECLKQCRAEIQPQYVPEIDEEYAYRLTYKWTSSRKRGWEICEIDNSLKSISDILNSHDKQIRKEIDDRIKALEVELNDL